MRYRTRVVISVLFGIAICGSTGCRDENPTDPVADSYLMDYSDFQGFEYVRLASLLCIPDGGVRTMWISRDDPEEYSVGFKLVQGGYCGSGDTLKVETVTPRAMSAVEVDSMLAFFSQVEIHRSLEDECIFGPIVPILARWDADVWARDCTLDYMEIATTSRLNSLVDALLQRSFSRREPSK